MTLKKNTEEFYRILFLQNWLVQGSQYGFTQSLVNLNTTGNYTLLKNDRFGPKIRRVSARGSGYKFRKVRARAGDISLGKAGIGFKKSN